MTRKTLRKMGRDRQPDQHKNSAYMGKEEVREWTWIIYKLV
jgi:hypothetical protein